MAFVSPGAYSRELDLSMYAQILSSTILGLVGVFSKGEMNTRTAITSQAMLETEFGPPVSGIAGFYAAREFLRQGNQLYVTRVGHAASLTKGSCTAVSAGPVNTLTFRGKTNGTWIDGAYLFITAGTNPGTFKATFQYLGVAVEAFDNLTKATAESVINDATDGSEWIEVVNLPAGAEPEVQTLTFSGGTNGDSALAASDVIGTQSAQTGIYSFYNSEEVDINLLTAPGFAGLSDGDAVETALLTLAEARADTLAIIDSPGWSVIDSVQDIIDWHNGTAPTWTHSAFNSSYGCLFWPEAKVYDEWNSQYEWISPAGLAAAAMSYTDRIAYPWYAPAGLRRGMLKTASSIRYSPNQGDRDFMYGAGSGNAVNPLVNFAGKGIAIYGQRTLQRAQTALDRINVRRMLLQVEKQIATVAAYCAFEQSDEYLWREFKALARPPLDYVLRRRGINAYAIVMDETTNPAEVQEANMAQGKIYIKPTKTAEIILIDYVITPQGANFSEMISA